jgi:O-antigen/teichoic acid export membrane protein
MKRQSFAEMKNICLRFKERLLSRDSYNNGKKMSEKLSKQSRTQDSLKEKTAKGLFWGGLSNVLQQVAGMVFGIIIARILKPSDYGLVAMLGIFSVFAATIIDSGFAVALVNKRDASHSDYNAVFWFGTLTGAALYLVLFFAAPLIAKFYGQPELTALSRIVFLGFLAGGTGTVHYAILLKNMKAKQMGMANVCAVSLSSAAGLILALCGCSYWGLAIQQVSFIVFCVVFRWHFSGWRPTFQFDFSPLKEMFGFSSKILATGILTQIFVNLLPSFSGKFYGDRQTGYYSQGNKWVVLVMSLTTGMFASILQPALLEAGNDKQRQLNVFRKMIRFGAFVSFPLMLGLGFAGREFVLILLGDKWLESVKYLQLMCLWGAAGFLWVLASQMLTVHGKSNTQMWNAATMLCLQICALTLVYPLGLEAMAIAYLVSLFAGLLRGLYFVCKLTGLKARHILTDIAPYLSITLLSILAAHLAARHIENIYLLFALKTGILATLYILAMRFGNSAIYRECMDFLLKRKI